MIGLFLELLTNMIILVTKPFSLITLVCLLGARTVGLVTLTWLQLVKAIINFHIDVCWRIMIWTIALVFFPIRVLTALQRERLLEMHLHEMQIQFESLLWENKELGERLEIAIKDRGIMETILVEIEEEHEKAVAKVHLLENEMQDLKDENLRLNEIQGKGLWNLKAGYNAAAGNVEDDSCGFPPLVMDCSDPSWKSNFNRNEVILQDLLHGDAWDNENGGKPKHLYSLKPALKAAQSYLFPPRITSRNSIVEETLLLQRRGVAVSQSAFSAILSLLVGIIIWEAKDPCMPLVIALFTVVGMSLMSVVQFFSTIKNRPASDAVALLSFNWFILGTLTSPNLPSVAHMLAPLALRFADRVVSMLGFSS